MIWDESAPVYYKGKAYEVRDSFDNVLLVSKLYEEEGLELFEKIRQALKILLRNPLKARRLSDLEKLELLELITKEKIKLPKRPQVEPPRRIMDFDADSGYIYASFMQAYGLDLAAERGRMPWKRFHALLEGLPDDTKLKEVLKIRSMDIPAPTKHNQKQIQDICKLKMLYALPLKDTGEKNGLDMLFDTLEGMARHG